MKSSSFAGREHYLYYYHYHYDCKKVGGKKKDRNQIKSFKEKRKNRGEREESEGKEKRESERKLREESLQKFKFFSITHNIHLMQGSL